MMFANKEISSRAAKDLLPLILKETKATRELATEKGLLQQSDEGAIAKIVDQIIAENPAVFAEYQGGKEQALQFLLGQGMKLSRGSANPEVLKQMLTDRAGKEA